MLVKIDCSLGTTDELARSVNMMRCIAAIATAPAGSTPVVYALTAPSTTSTVNLITSVIANTEAGGWTESASSNGNILAYSATSATSYILDFYNQNTGKSQYPYTKMTFRTRYPLNNASYLTYPNLVMTAGVSPVATYTGIYSTGQTNAAQVSNLLTVNTSGILNGPTISNTTVNNGEVVFKPASGEILIGSTANYFFALSKYGILWWGVRSTQQWETAYSDNPSWCGWWMDANNTNFATGMAIWYTANNSGVYTSAPQFYYQTNFTGTANATTWNPMTGNSFYAPSTTVGNSDAWYAYYMVSRNGASWSNGIWSMPVVLPCSNDGNTPTTEYNPPVTDSATGLLVPPAYPLNLVRNQTGSLNGGGSCYGLYKSMSGADTYINQYYTAGQTFTVASDTYYAYAIGSNTLARDLWLVRKA